MNKLPRNGVRFNEEAHTYTREADGKVLHGVTKMIHDVLFPDEFNRVDKGMLAAKAEYGTVRHREIQDMIVFHDEPTTSDQIRFVDMIYGKIHPIKSEYTVTDGEDFASNIDVVGVDNDGEIVLIDIKTCASLNREKVSWQLSFYADWFEKCVGREIKGLYAAWLPKVGDARLVEVYRKPSDELEKVKRAWLNGETYISESRLDINLVNRVAELKEAMDNIKAEYDEKVLLLMHEMQSKGEVSYKSDYVTISYRQGGKSKRFDAKSFEKAYPEIYNEFQVENETNPSVTVKLK